VQFPLFGGTLVLYSFYLKFPSNVSLSVSGFCLFYFYTFMYNSPPK